MLRRRQFRYDTLLRVRRIEEDQQAQKLGAVRRKVQAAVKERDFIEDEQRRILAEASEHTCQSFDSGDVGRYYLYERHLARRAVEMDAHIAALRREEEKERASLEEASKRKRIVEKLEERHVENLAAGRAKDEQKASDESAVGRSARRRLGRELS